MKIIETSSFQLACYINGDTNSEKLFLCLPGFLDAGNYEHLKAHRAYFSDRGFLSVSFDPPGTFSSPGDISLYSVTDYLQAIYEVIAYFGNKETIVLGHSMGGTMALLASFKNPLISKVIAIMSPGDCKTGLLLSSREQWLQNGVKTGTRDLPGGGIWSYKVPYVFIEDALQYDMIEDLKHSSKPKLFIVGKDDALVNPQIVKAGYDYAGEPKQLVEIYCYDHNYRHFPEAVEEVNQKVEDFISNY